MKSLRWLIGLFCLWVSLCQASALTPTGVAATQTKTQDAPNSPVTLNDKTGFVIPFAYDPPIRPLLTIQVRVNKSKPMTFLLDTGWESALFLLPWAAKELQLKTVGEGVPTTPGGPKAF